VGTVGRQSFRLLNVDIHVAFSVKEGVLTIDMQDVKVVCSCNCENNADGVNSDDESKGFVEIKSSDLRVALYNDSVTRGCRMAQLGRTGAAESG
jgi:hypothetical protein